MNRTEQLTGKDIIRLYFLAGGAIAFFGGLLIAFTGKIAEVFDWSGFFSAWLITSLVLALVFLIAVIAFLFPAFRSAVVGAVELRTGRNMDSDPRVGNGLAPAQVDPRSGALIGSGVPLRLPMSQERIDAMVEDVIAANGDFTESVLVGAGKAFTSNGDTFQVVKRELAALKWLEKRGNALCLSAEGLNAFYRHNSRRNLPSPTGKTYPNLNETGA